MRLNTCLKYIKGSILADVGCDHGYLAINAIKNNIVDLAYCLDINKEPLNNALNNIKQNNLEDKIKTILSDGLDLLPDCDTITILGMGGILIKDIINKNRDKIKNQRLILGPNNNQAVLRKYLNESNFKIIDEELVMDKSHIYEIIVVEVGKMDLSNEEIDFGPVLLKKKDDLFKQKYNYILSNLTKQLDKAKDQSSLMGKINYIKKNLEE